MEHAREYDDPAAVLAFAGASQRTVQQAEADVLAAAVTWAAMHSEDSIVPALGHWENCLPLAGEGTPEVAEFAIAEFAAVLGRTTQSGRLFIGDALELAHRLPQHYARTQDGTLPLWRARKIAQATRCLPPDGAAFVDEALHRFAHSMTWAQLDRTIEEALVRFDPDQARENAERAAENRKVDIHTEQINSNGTIDFHGSADIKDAYDLEAAIARRAGFLADAYPDLSLDVRRALALGDMARADLALDLATGEPTPTSTAGTGGGIELRVHIDAEMLHDAVTEDQAGTSTREAQLVRLEKARSFLHLDQLRDWMSRPDTTITLRPVIDLTETIAVDSYEIPQRLRDQVNERDHHCGFPWCTSRVTDLDHIEPFDHGPPDGPAPPGQTNTGNLARICRPHHRLKTHGGWTYRMLHPGTYLWTSPHSHRFLVTPSGTTKL